MAGSMKPDTVNINSMRFGAILKKGLLFFFYQKMFRALNTTTP